MPSVVNKNLLVFNPNITKDRVENNELVITDGTNIIPTYNGYCTGLGKTYKFYFPVSRDTILYDIVELQDGAGFVIITNNCLYRYNKDTGTGSLLVHYAVTAKKCSYAYIGSYYYFLIDSIMYKYDHIDNTIIAQQPTGFPNNANYIIATNNRLVALSDDVVAWSAIGDGDDFAPSLDTGAGFQSLDSLSTGKGVALAAKKNGFVVFTTDNVISATELNTALVYNFKEVSKHVIYNRDCCCTSTFGKVYFIDTEKNLYSYEDLGSLGSGGFKIVNENLNDYFNKLNSVINKLSVKYSRYIVINYDNSILGIDLLFNRLFKAKTLMLGIRGFGALHKDYYVEFDYRKTVDNTFNDIAYYANTLDLVGSSTLGVAVINVFADVPYSNAPQSIKHNLLEPEFANSITPSINLFYEDLNDSFIYEDLNNSNIDIDLDTIDNSISCCVEISAAFEFYSVISAASNSNITAMFEFASLHFSPEVPIECTSVITRIDTNITDNQDYFTMNCQANGDEPIYDCAVSLKPDFMVNMESVGDYEVELEVDSSTDAYGQRPHHLTPVLDKYFAGKRLIGNVYTTGVYHYIKYTITGYAEITGIQINLFKGGYIYDRYTK